MRSFNFYRFERIVYTIVVLTRLSREEQLHFSYCANKVSSINGHWFSWL